MSKKAVSGYIVINADGQGLELDRYREDEPLILLWGDRVTVFSDRRKARNAIRRTVRYAQKRLVRPGRVWFEHKIVSLIAEE